MEFSFDRSNESRLRNTSSAEAKVEAQPAFSQTASTQSTNYNDGVDTSTITNERLRKAIEKNRARQAERARQNPNPPMQNHSETGNHQQASFFDKQKHSAPEVESQSTQRMPPPRPRAEERPQPQKATGIVTRRSVARADEAEFTPVKRAQRKVASQISYTTTNRKKAKPIDPTLVGYLVKGCWIFCAIMVLRLIFVHGGVTDYYSQRSLFNDRVSELDKIKKENMQLVHEIERMQTDSSFQKKLVRDNLGFIASDEFLVLFPKEKSVQ